MASSGARGDRQVPQQLPPVSASPPCLLQFQARQVRQLRTHHFWADAPVVHIPYHGNALGQLAAGPGTGAAQAAGGNIRPQPQRKEQGAASALSLLACPHDSLVHRHNCAVARPQQSHNNHTARPLPLAAAAPDALHRPLPPLTACPASRRAAALPPGLLPCSCSLSSRPTGAAGTSHSPLGTAAIIKQRGGMQKGRGVGSLGWEDK